MWQQDWGANLSSGQGQGRSLVDETGRLELADAEQRTEPTSERARVARFSSEHRVRVRFWREQVPVASRAQKEVRRVTDP